MSLKTVDGVVVITIESSLIVIVFRIPAVDVDIDAGSFNMVLVY